MRLPNHFVRAASEIGAAIGAEFVAGVYGALALGTGGIQVMPASGAKAEAGLKGPAALRAGCDERLPQYEVQHDAERVGDEDCEECPAKAAHSAAACVAVHISDQQDVTGHHSSSQSSHRYHGRQRHGRFLPGKSREHYRRKDDYVGNNCKDESHWRNNVYFIHKAR
jgi:hypothetical protein